MNRSRCSPEKEESYCQRRGQPWHPAPITASYPCLVIGRRHDEHPLRFNKLLKIHSEDIAYLFNKALPHQASPGSGLHCNLASMRLVVSPVECHKVFLLTQKARWPVLHGRLESFVSGIAEELHTDAVWIIKVQFCCPRPPLIGTI